MKTPESELAWRLADYTATGTEPPHRCVTNPELTEGEMMSDDEIEEFIKDSVATLRILGDHHSKRYGELVKNYQTDLAYLLELGRISEDDYNDLTNPANLRF